MSMHNNASIRTLLIPAVDIRHHALDVPPQYTISYIPLRTFFPRGAADDNPNLVILPAIL